MQATYIFIEEEVEYDLRKMVDVVKKTVERVSFLDGNPKIILWQAPLYDIKVMNFDIPNLFSTSGVHRCVLCLCILSFFRVQPEGTACVT